MPRVFLRALLYVLLIVLSILFLVPVLWMLLMAIRPSSITVAEPLQLIFTPDFSSFAYLFTSGGGLKSLVASVIQSGIATLVAMPLAITACYGLTRWRYRGRNLLGMWYLSLMLAPPVVFVIPLFIMLSTIGVVGTNWAAVIAFQTFSIPLAVLLLRSFFEELPVEIEEAALLDGCSRWRILVQVFLPVLRPGLLVAAIFVFCFGWNNLLFVMPLTSGDSIPLTVRALSFYATSGVNWTYIGATAVLSMIVPMLLFFLFRKHIVSGLTFGAVK
ncbi:carbohydrate ABC transporter permease [Leucobacter weissii]|uniref:Carbohydrate ABC transporter permease n=1 Tax=Leucobacter weissii TaxID=1983706 RepID=A0A939SAY7_9MICO|nr:carbohydrate ABC transporter permease [Leucobacter weissii]MBO1902442.1 carbohydrate ABC transporter permease [Leucobacter weissii]